MAKILLLSKTGEWSEKAGKLATIFFREDVTWRKGNFGDKFPSDITGKKYDVIISFLSPWIIPDEMLKNAKIAVNFHPASREYPGIGCYNFALYENAKEYGCVCHCMARKVDAGNIIFEERFPILPNDTVETLKFRTMVSMLSLFHEVLFAISKGTPLPQASIEWTRKPFTRKELNDLTVLRKDMSEEEIQKRIKATTYPGYPAASFTEDFTKKR